MGANYSLNVSRERHPPPGIIAKIVHDKFTTTAGLDDQPIPDGLLKTGTLVMTGRTHNLLQSRDIYPPITVTEVKFKDGTSDLYLTTTLAPAK